MSKEEALTKLAEMFVDHALDCNQCEAVTAATAGRSDEAVAQLCNKGQIICKAAKVLEEHPEFEP